MPIYEYACDACGAEFEREQRMTDKPVRTCPKCKARKVRRLISRTSFVLKGGGWYSDLYSTPKPDSKGASEGKESGSEGKDSGKGSGKEPKSESKSGGTSKPGGSKGKPKAKAAA